MQLNQRRGRGRGQRRVGRREELDALSEAFSTQGNSPPVNVGPGSWFLLRFTLREGPVAFTPDILRVRARLGRVSVRVPPSHPRRQNWRPGMDQLGERTSVGLVNLPAGLPSGYGSCEKKKKKKEVRSLCATTKIVHNFLGIRSNCLYLSIFAVKFHHS